MGCGCSNNFNAKAQPCTCGRNQGGRCQCDSKMSFNKKLENNRKKFSSFIGEETMSPQINVRDYGFANEHYYEFNDKYSMYRGIKKQDLLSTDF